MASQQLKQSEATVKKVANGLDSQWNAVLDMARSEYKNNFSVLSPNQQQQFLSDAGNDRDQRVTDAVHDASPRHRAPPRSASR